MTDAAIQPRTAVLAGPVRPKLDGGFDPRVTFTFIGLLAVAILFVAYSLYSDISVAGGEPKTFLPYLLLFVALLTALGFEFVNGFHDTANAVAA